MIPLWLQAGFWGLVAGSALLVGAGLGYFVRIPQRAIASIMAFGAGVLISALSFELMDVAYREGGFDIFIQYSRRAIERGRHEAVRTIAALCL